MQPKQPRAAPCDRTCTLRPFQSYLCPILYPLPSCLLLLFSALPCLVLLCPVLCLLPSCSLLLLSSTPSLVLSCSALSCLLVSYVSCLLEILFHPLLYASLHSFSNPFLLSLIHTSPSVPNSLHHAIDNLSTTSSASPKGRSLTQLGGDSLRIAQLAVDAE